MKAKPYQAKSLSGAQAEVRRLRRLLKQRQDLLDRYHDDRRVLARLAAEGPAFFNPMYSPQSDCATRSCDATR